MENRNNPEQNDWEDASIGRGRGFLSTSALAMRGVGRGRGRHDMPPPAPSQAIEPQYSTQPSQPTQPQTIQETVAQPVQTFDPRNGPKFIPPSADFPPLEASQAPANKSASNQKPFKGKTYKWTRDTAARRAPDDSTHPFILQQQALRLQKEAFEQKQKKLGRSAPVDVSDDSGDECHDDEDGPQSSMLSLVREKFRIKEEQALQQQQQELITEGISLNPAMPVEWLERVLTIYLEDHVSDVVYPRHDEVVGSSVPIGSLQVQYTSLLFLCLLIFYLPP